MNWFQTIRDRIGSAHPDHHAIARGMAWVSLFVLLGSVARAAKEVAVAYRYGVSAEVDAYLFVFNLVTWPVGIWFSVLTVVLVPLAARIQQGASGELPRFRSELLGLTIVFGVALAFLGWVGLPLLLRSSWVGLAANTVAVATSMVPILMLLAPLGVVISLLSAWMLASSRHMNTLLESVPALIILTALIAFPGGGTQPLVWGTLAGFTFHLISLIVPLKRKGEINAPYFTNQSSHWKSFLQGFGIMLAGQTLMSLTTIMDQFFAAPLGTGAISTLNYANRVLALILGVGALAVSRATLPVFSQAQGDRQMARMATHWVKIMFVLGVAIMIISWMLAPYGVKLLFERGAFSSNNTIIVTEVLRYGLVQLPFYFSGIVLISLLSSQGRYRVIASIAALNLIAKLLAIIILTPVLGVKGIALSTSIMYMMTLLLLCNNVKKQ